jgi:hypothetical protein
MKYIDRAVPAGVQKASLIDRKRSARNGEGSYLISLPGMTILALTCPKCGCIDVDLSMSRPLERLLILLWLRPYRCVACYHRFIRFRRRKWVPGPTD